MPGFEMKVDIEKMRRLFEKGEELPDGRFRFVTSTEIGELCGCTKQHVNRKAKALKWKRDLTERVQTRVQQQLAVDDAKSEDEQRAVEEQAEVAVDARRAHKAELKRLRDRIERTGKLLDKLLDKAESTQFLTDKTVHSIAQLEGVLTNSITKLVAMEERIYQLPMFGPALPQTEAIGDIETQETLAKARSSEQRAKDLIRLVSGGAGPADRLAESA